MKKLITLSLVLLLGACTSFIYRIDIPQGNYLTKRDVEKLRIGMSREQVLYVLGSPIVEDPFAHDKWHYLYKMKQGKTGELFTTEFLITFENDKLKTAEGDFELSEDFNTPIE